KLGQGDDAGDVGQVLERSRHEGIEPAPLEGFSQSFRLVRIRRTLRLSGDSDVVTIRPDKSALVRQKPSLAPETAGVPGERTIRSDDAMTRHYDGKWISAIDRTHRSDRSRSSDLSGELRVGDRVARRNSTKRGPYLLLKRRPACLHGERVDRS